MKFAVRQTFVKIFGINGRDGSVSSAVDNQYRRLYLRQNLTECFKLRWIGPHITHRFCESIALVRCEVVGSSGIADNIPLKRLNYVLDNLTSVNLSVRLEIGSK